MERIHTPYVRFAEHPAKVVKAGLEGATRSPFFRGRDLTEYTKQRAWRLFLNKRQDRQPI